MSNDSSTEPIQSNDEPDQVVKKLEQRTVPSLADVQSFCAEFHVKVENAAGIRPWLQFSDTHFPEKILNQFEEHEFDIPTPIQSIAWPILSQNRDLLAIINSGSGKTLAFILPLIFQIRKQSNDNFIAIILTATRESVQNISNSAQPYFNLLGIKSLCIVNGDEHEKQINEIHEGRHVYISTPQRCNEFLETQVINVHQVTFIALDDTDKMLETNSEGQIRKILDRFKSTNTDERQQPIQTSIFSSMPSKSLKSLADNYLTNYVHAIVGYLSEFNSMNFNAQQIVDFCPTEQHKQQNLFRILDEVCAYAPMRKTIIFVRTRDKINRLHKELEHSGYRALVLHGTINQNARNEILREFRESQNVLLLTTDVASRSFDVEDVRFIINYDYPNSDTAYKHRLMQIAHCNMAFTFFSNDDGKHAPALIQFLDECNAVVHPVILQIGRRFGFNKWVANVSIPQYPIYDTYGNFDDDDGQDDWSDQNFDLPPNLMSIDLNSFDPSQLRPPPMPLLNTNGQPNEFDVNTRMKNFQDYKQRCFMLERLYSNENQNDNWNNGAWSNPDNDNQNNNHINIDTTPKPPPVINDTNQWKPQPPVDPSETNPAIIYAKASSEYQIEYNQYTTALQQAMLAQQAGTQITPEQQQYLLTFQQKLQAKQQQLQVMQQAAALSATTNNAWNQQQMSSKPQLSNDLTKTVTDAQQAWMQQWMSAGYDASQIAAYQQWYTQMQMAASLAASTNLYKQQPPTTSYNAMPTSTNQTSSVTISAPPTVSSSSSSSVSAAQRAYAAYSNRGTMS